MHTDARVGSAKILEKVARDWAKGTSQTEFTWQRKDVLPLDGSFSRWF